MVRRKQNVEAADYFMQLAGQFPQHDRAEEAAHNACLVYMLLIEDRQKQGQDVSMLLRRKFLDALKVLTGNASWAADRPQWFFDLGWQSEQVAYGGAQSQAEQNQLLRQAVDAYAAVPREQSQYMQARNRELELRARLLRRVEEGGARAVAQALVDELAAYAREAMAAAEGMSSPQRKADLAQWAGNARYQRAVLISEVMGDSQAGIQAAMQVAKDFPNTDVGRDSQEFVIRKYIEQGQVDQAIAEVETFRRTYPEQAAPLLSQIVGSIRSRIQSLQRDPAARAELDTYRKVYMNFAKVLLDRAQAQGQGGKDLFEERLLYADSLVQGGRGREALGILEDLEKIHDQQRQQRIASINQQVAQVQRQLESAGDSASRWQTAERAYQALKSSLGLEDRTFSSELALASAMERLKRASEASEQAQAMRNVRAVLGAALEDLSQAAQRSVGLDAGVMLGLARAYAASGQGEKALKYYASLTGGLNPEANEWMYWQSQLEFAQVALETYKNDPKQMAQLASRIRSMRARSPQMGGLLNEFAAIQAQAEQL